MLALLGNQLRFAKLGEVERQRAVWNAEPFGDRPRGHSIISGLDKQPEQGQPMLPRQRAQSREGSFQLH